jgi:hypothetical protein
LQKGEKRKTVKNPTPVDKTRSASPTPPQYVPKEQRVSPGIREGLDLHSASTRGASTNYSSPEQIPGLAVPPENEQNMIMKMKLQDEICRKLPVRKCTQPCYIQTVSKKGIFGQKRNVKECYYINK